MNMPLCAAEDLHQINFYFFSASRLSGNLMLECLHLSSIAGSLYDWVNAVIVGVLLKYIASLSVDCANIYSNAPWLTICVLLFYSCTSVIWTMSLW